MCLVMFYIVGYGLVIVWLFLVMFGYVFVALGLVFIIDCMRCFRFGVDMCLNAVLLNITSMLNPYISQRRD